MDSNNARHNTASNMSASSQARSRLQETGEETAGLSADNIITQEHSLQLVENLRKVYEEEDCFLHDVTLVSREKGEVKAHRIILAVQSDYFKVSLTIDSGRHCNNDCIPVVYVS